MQKNQIKSIHPFPARMAPSILWDVLPNSEKPLTVLDPMTGSGTTVTIARMKGHNSIGFDADPLAVLIAKVWSNNINSKLVLKKAKKVLDEAQLLCKKTKGKDAYPLNADEETKKFIRYWFDLKNRKQLRALSVVIFNLNDLKIRSVLWCALSRLIITKKAGVSLAMDISHSRPHKVYKIAPFTPFDKFLNSVSYIIKNAPFTEMGKKSTFARVKLGDARDLPLEDDCIDFIITSPPYLNAIDYLRGHKLSLVWMGYKINEIRQIRSENIGSENNRIKNIVHNFKEKIIQQKLSERMKNVLSQYVYDMDRVLKETYRVLKKDGHAVFVVGNSTIKGTFIKNSQFVKELAEENGFTTCSVRNRNLPPNRRYLPPPSSHSAGVDLSKRMREEAIITFIK